MWVILSYAVPSATATALGMQILLCADPFFFLIFRGNGGLLNLQESSEAYTFGTK